MCRPWRRQEGTLSDEPDDETLKASGALTKPTLRTIAQMTGLAVTTVSRALSNAPELAQETRERVQRIAREVGYLPDRTALRLKTGRTHVICLILDAKDEVLGFGRAMVNGLTRALRGTAYHLVITPTFDDQPPLAPIETIIRNRMADGVIFARTVPDDARVKLLLEADFPFVTHGRTAIATPHPFVDYDNFAFAREAVHRLAARGRRRLGIILPPGDYMFGRHLRDGFLAGLAETGLLGDVAPGATLDDPAEAIREAIIASLAGPDAPDGYVATGDAAALAILAAILDSGLSLGTDVDMVAKQVTPIFSLVRPPLDAIFEDIDLAGLQLGQLLLRRIAGEPATALQILHRPGGS
jgi:LacI family transcriptional regulator